MKKIKALNVHLKISIVTLILTGIVVAICSFCFVNGHESIPLGFLLGGGVGAFVYFLQYLADLLDRNNEAMTFAIITLIVRFLLFAAILIVVIFLYYKQGMKIFNVFAYVGGFLLSVVVHAVTLLVTKEKENNDTK